ncbi:MAG: ABC-type xylose transport system, permease component [Thermocaproicibacter melissae]|jgi:putative multiple sugar transport system permease protein|uniref:multiple monosaccharide ABC transporter permease n=1 Tax=Thermocaproicibacter melissae TaxID=2966552 RepID=UPI0024B212FB|nr:multiple monosaccharide ABC transporter permease [Thermocaproicibacter melissae]WBY64076.1 sugar ABC transporter permease [Thermocaproicibacter melissae]
MDSFKKVVKNNLRQYTMLIALILLMIIFQFATGGVLFRPMNINNVILQNAYVFILAVGMMLLLINGGNIDMSVGSVLAFISAILGIMLIKNHQPLWLAIIVALLLGFGIGAWQGFWVGYYRMPGFLVTLAGQLIFRGLTTRVLDGMTLAPFDKSFQYISSGFIPDIFQFTGSSVNITAYLVGAIITILLIIMEIRKRAQQAKYTSNILSKPLFIAKLVLIAAAIMLLSYFFAAYEGIPVVFIIITVLVVAYSIFTTKTVPGRYIYAMGGNERAAKLSGINTNKVLCLCYVNMGVLTAVAAIVSAARMNAASPLVGQGYDLDAISSCFIGGASMYGGVGTVVGAIIGALFMGVLNNGMSIMGIGTDIQQVVKGLVLIFAVAFDIYSKSRAKAK